jgi:uncharacterized protein (DUF885 family)
MKRIVLLGALALAPATVAAEESAASKLHALFGEAWEFGLRENPLFATWTGDARFNDRLPSLTPRDLERRKGYWRQVAERLAGIDRTALSPEDQISYDVFARDVTDARAEHAFGTHRMSLTTDSGFHIAFARLPNLAPLATATDYEHYIARLKAFPTYVEQQIALMRSGIEAGFTLPQVVLDGYEVTIASHVVDDPAESVFYAPFRAYPSGVPESERARIEAAGRAAITEAVVPGYRAFLEFMTGEYMPGARQTTGASELPNGRAYYEHLVRHFTTLDVTPEEVHQIGLAEVKRIRAEMEEIVRQVGFQGTFSDFLEHLRTDPRFYAKTTDELLMRAAWIAKRMDGKLPALFKTLPRQPYGIEPVPDHLAPKYTGGRYVGAPLGGRRGGYYWVNTHALENRPLYTLEALTLHEAVPGHHLQNALSKELEGLPHFRRYGGISAYGEGWGLYSEWLGLEAGFYTDPYSNFGRLTYEMWRACRLVVDTGLHALGWTRQQTLDYLAANTALSRHEIRTETDRYISWPGQALAYKMGELKIQQLRREAEEALGPRFDVREFHDVVLGSGPVPLPVLERLVAAWITAQGNGE